MALMRIRTIKPEFYQHEILAFLPDATQLFYIGLWLLCDRRGRLEDRPLRIRSAVYPYGTKTQEQVNSMLSELEENGFIIRYQAQVRGETLKLIFCPGYVKNQTASSLAKEPESLFPPPEGYTHAGVPFERPNQQPELPGLLREDSGSAPVEPPEESRNNPGESQEESGNTSGGLQGGRERKGKEGKGSKEEASASPPPVSEESALTTQDDGFRKALRQTFDQMNMRNGKPFYDNWGREQKATGILEGMLRARASPKGDQEALFAYAKAFFTTARELKAGEQFPMKGQPFTAGSLSSSGIFSRIAELAEKGFEVQTADWIEDPAEAVT